jgi:CheY-like chemotaxis protein
MVAAKRILVVDDEQIVRDSCMRALTDAGYAVRTVGSGHDALRACRDEPFDVMLTDLKMPDMDGLEVIQAVADEFPGIRVVVITGYPSRESIEKAEKLGVSDYLEKPLSPARLSAATEEALTHPPRFRAPVFPAAASDSDVGTTVDAALPEPGDVASVVPAIPDVAAPKVAEEAPRSEEAPSEEVVEAEVSTFKTLTLLVAAPIIGGAYVALLPAIGFGMLVGIIGMGVGKKLGLVQK